MTLINAEQSMEATVMWFTAYNNLRRPVQKYLSLLDSGEQEPEKLYKLLNEMRDQIKEIK